MLIKLYLVRINNSRTLPDRVSQHVKFPPTRHLYTSTITTDVPPPSSTITTAADTKNTTGQDATDATVTRERVGKATGARVYKVRVLFSVLYCAPTFQVEST